MNRHTHASRSAITFLVLLLVALVPSTAQPPANPDYQAGFPVDLNGTRVARSSVALGDLDGDLIPEIIVGGKDGTVHVYNGSGVEQWTFNAGTMQIDGKAAIGDVDLDGAIEVVVPVGSTDTSNGTGAGVYVLSNLGVQRCYFETRDSFALNGLPDGVFSSPALADIDQNDDGKLEIVFGAWDGYVYVINHDCTLVFEKHVRDTVWSSPAIGDLDMDGQLEIVIGVDSHFEGPPFNTEDGGILHVYQTDGSERSGFPIQLDEVIWSSPSLGDLDGDGWLDIVVGTGNCWEDAACAPGGNTHPVTEAIYAFDRNGIPLIGWPKILPDAFSFSSPALADLDNDGELEVVFNTVDPSDQNLGQVYALNGDGTPVPGWPVRPMTPATATTNVSFSTRASPVVADITGDGRLEVILPSNFHLVIFDWQGQQLSRFVPTDPSQLRLQTEFSVAGGAAVGDVDGDGDLEVLVGGGRSGGSTGAIWAWDFSTSTSAARPWPVFRANQHNQGIGDVPIFADGFESGDTTAWSSSAP